MSEFIRFIKYNFAAGIATLTDLSLYWSLITFTSINYLIAASITLCIGILINYSINRILAFKGTKINYFRGLFFFSIIAISALFIALLILYTLVEFFGIGKFTARVLVVFIIVFYNYTLNYFLTFKQHNNKK